MGHPFDINPASTSFIIDWQELCKTADISTKTEAVIDMASTEDKLWPGLLKIACQELKGKSIYL
ncbi:hypothetical protein [Legionella fairfieldensis]|uniref:hypothetical protein n=1 Tax=Legionella fairfieldensis TaxID=45064 RepID=UPI0010417516|nr:hypothetical protein [Legionella fairfieldensis]